MLYVFNYILLSRMFTPIITFHQDCLNYEVDSDSEWEDEGEGEDIDSENDSDKEPSDEENCDEKNENGYILDNTFVPHGYLSDEEIEENEDNFVSNLIYNFQFSSVVQDKEKIS